ncbi:MAG TPA: hypothetical protein P5080_04280 [Candidatus Paceibacterota bacterium]|nr:hypothetical protein [Candidatus Pacearchaeota archaeon]HRZ51102.1 hypothetical protein [Candidatus Paceibacterota bacterium]HSA36891.1 hypothetical protein [Candidatus Paceibacterota bacterium]
MTKRNLILTVVLAVISQFLCQTLVAQTIDRNVRIKALVLPESVPTPRFSTPTYFESVALRPNPIIINGGDAETSTSKVDLAFDVGNAFQTQISNWPDFYGSVWEPYSDHRQWTLLPQDGERTVYARFKTLSGVNSKVVSDSIILDMTPPANVSYFTATGFENQIELNWVNPTDLDFSGVLILRSDQFYPADRESGVPVYDGGGENYVDKGLESGKTYYYAAFAYDKLGNSASGAVAAAATQIRGAPPINPPEILVVDPPRGVKRINLDDFDFIQDGELLDLENESVELDRTKTFTVSIPYDKVPEVLKTIMVTLEKDGKSFSFILRANPSKTAYQATIVPPDSGVYPLTITILDYQNQAFKRIEGELNVLKIGSDKSKENRYIVVSKHSSPLVYIILTLFTVLIIQRAYKKLKNKKKNDPETGPATG